MNRYLIKALAIVVVLTVPSHAQEMDRACKQRFIDCVQKTGNPMQCHAVSAACIGGVVVDQSGSLVEETINLNQRNGETYVKMTVKNTGHKDVQIGTRSWGFSCADGSHEVLYFMFGGTGVLPGASLVSGEIVACFGKGLVISDEKAPVNKPPVSLSKIDFYCDQKETLLVEVIVKGERLVRFQRNDGFWGTHRLSKVDGTDLVSAACEYSQDQQIAQWKRLKNESAEVTGFVGRIIESLGFSSDEFENNTTATSIRN